MIEEHGVVYVRRVIKREKATVIPKVPTHCFEVSNSIGAVRDHTSSFVQTRQKAVDRTYLEVNRLEKRLTKVMRFIIVLTVVTGVDGESTETGAYIRRILQIPHRRPKSTKVT